MIIDYSVRLIVIDSFCGAGGVTEGFHRAEDENGNKICKVIIGINHDEVAIKSHAVNHPDTIHFVEDFTTLDPNRLVSIVNLAQIRYPNAKILFWASAECTHHSKAKGGLPRDADSRSLPEHIERYVKVLNPDIIGVENVTEFVDWGPLDDFGKPVKDKKGVYYNQWRDTLMNLGYQYEWRKLNAADFAAYTSRIRYFGIFAKEAENIAFPAQTHSRNAKNGLLKWNAVKDVLNLDIEGESIFNRKKALVDATLERIIAGVEKFVINHNEDIFVSRYNSGSPQHRNSSLHSPCGVVTTNNRFALVKPKFISKAFSGRPQHKNQSINNPAGSITTIDHHQLITAYYGNGYNSSIEEPLGTITTKDRFALITSKFIASSYSGGGQISDINTPSQSLLTIPKQNVVSVKFMDQQYGMSKPSGINQPVGSLTTNPKFNLLSAHWLMDTQFRNTGRSINEAGPTITANRKQFYLMNPQFSNKGSSINKPCFTLIARMDKMPPYLIQAKQGEISIRINENDTEVMKRLKNICNEHGIIDIMMRMLMIDELLRIQGFGDRYILKGTKAEMKKFIGNAVECTQAKVFAEAIGKTIHTDVMKQAL